MDYAGSNKQKDAEKLPLRRQLIFFLLIVGLIVAAIVRSAVTTSLDSFTYDEGYHIGAGAVHIQTGDFRLNPEQPPLTKLWVGAYVNLLGYESSPLRPFADKQDERDTIEIDVYEKNDPFVLQTRARAAMFALNGLLLLFFASALWRVFGPITSVGGTAFLAIDPTVAAHLPVVMTDLPIALAAGTAVLLSAHAFRTWKMVDLVLAGMALGLTLTAKHSGIVVFAALAVIGAACGLTVIKRAPSTALKRIGGVAAIILIAIAVLWASYGLKYDESPDTPGESFNRPLATKINDVRSPFYRFGLNTMAALRLFPRAYTWGLADTIRAGAEGRAVEIRAFGQKYYSKGPFYLFPGLVAVKLPIGLLVLSLIGLVLLVLRQLPREYFFPAVVLAVFSLLFLFVLMSGSSYGGIRHALPLYPLMAVLGGAAIYWLARSPVVWMKGGAALLLLAASVSAIPQMRPWEYFNEFAGSSENAYLNFNDEGVDLSQRVGEMAAYYHEHLAPKGELPVLAYFSNSIDRRRRGMDWVGKDRVRDAQLMEAEAITGTFMIGANELGEMSWWDVGAPFRGSSPKTRLGNVFIFEGTFPTSGAIRSRSIFYTTIYTNIYTDEPDIQAGIEGIRRSLDQDNSCYFVWLELGNQYIAAGDPAAALDAYRSALSRAPQSDSIYAVIGDQVRNIETLSFDQIAPIRNPGIE